MECTGCGAEIAETSTDCEYCGTPQAGAAPASPARPPASPAPPRAAASSPAGAPGAQRVHGSDLAAGGGFLSRLDREKQQGARVGLAVFAVFCLFCGVGGFVISGQQQALKAQVGRAMLRTPEEAMDTEGLVCVENAAAQVAQPYRIPSTEIDCLYVEEQRERRSRQSRTSSSRTSSRTKTKTTTTDHRAPSFMLGPLEVQTAGASFRATQQLHRTEDDVGTDRTTVTWTGIRAGGSLTVVGQVQGGKIAGGEPLLITPLASRKALLDDLQSSATMLKLGGVLAFILGLVAAGASFVAFRRA